MKKIYHLLKDNKTLKYPINYIFFDIETKPRKINYQEIKHELRLGVACYCCLSDKERREKEDWLYFSKSYDFWKWVESKIHKKERLLLISHNIQFDFQGVEGFKYLKKLGYRADKIILNGLTNIWRFRKKDKTILVLDNLNYFRLNLEGIGENIKLPKLKMPDFNEKDDVWFEYCRRDVEILKKCWSEWINFIKSNDLGSFGLTLPSQAFNAFRHRFMKHKIFIHNNQEATQIERRSYHGGRTEAFFIGELSNSDFYLLDVNSMYPYVMRNHLYPTKLIKIEEDVNLRFFEWALNKFSVIADVELLTKEPIYPCKIKNRLIFPIGHFETTLTTQEIKDAYQRGYLRKIKKLAYYEHQPIFVDYVDKLYELRNYYKKQNNTFYDFLCKLFLNSLYGKFGQRNEVFEFVGYVDNIDDQVIKSVVYETGEYITERIILGRYERSLGKSEAFNSFPAISSEVSANARMYLWRLIEKAGRENVYYCDTDSLIVNLKGLRNLIDLINPYKLGYLKIVKTSQNLEIRNVKDYTFDNEVKIKGIRKNALQIDDYTYLQSQFYGLRSLLRKKCLNCIIERKVFKVLKRAYYKGWVKDNGQVVPFNLDKGRIINPNFNVLNYDVIKKEFSNFFS